MIIAIFMLALSEIESGGDNKAIGGAGEVTRFQISQIALDEYNRIHDGDEITFEMLKDNRVSVAVTDKLLRHYKLAYVTKYGKDINPRSLAIMWRYGYYWDMNEDQRAKIDISYMARVENMYIHYRREHDQTPYSEIFKLLINGERYAN